MIVFNKKGNFFNSTLINDSQYFSAFGTKILGDGMNINNIFQFLKQKKIIFKKVIVLEQIHSTNVVFYQNINEGKFEKITETDGLITKEGGLALVVRTADCLPIIYVDKKNQIIGISHQGWRGSLKKMAVKMVEEITEVGGSKENIVVAIGPGIGLCCYQILEDRYYQFLEEFDGYSEKIFTFRKGQRFLNLLLLNYLLLVNAGIRKENIDFFPFCTFCDHKRFYSFRRDRKKGLRGEMFNIIIKNY